MPLKEIVENDNLDEIDNMDSESVLMSGVCLGYIMGMLEGVQVGWASNRDGEKYCENIDGRLGFVCTATIKDVGQLDGDHKDGNPRNNDPKNIQTLCASCHRYKTMKNKDYLTAGRKTKVNKNSNTLDEFMN